MESTATTAKTNPQIVVGPLSAMPNPAVVTEELKQKMIAQEKEAREAAKNAW